jgi:hypothetical protein
MVIGGEGVHYPILTMNIFVPTPEPDFFYLLQRNKNALPVAPAMMTIKQRNKLYSMTKRVIKEVFTDFNTRESYGEQLIDARYDVTSTNGGDFWKRIKYVYDEYYVGLVPGFNLLEYHIRQCGIDADTDNNDDFNAEFWSYQPQVHPQRIFVKPPSPAYQTTACSLRTGLCSFQRNTLCAQSGMHGGIHHGDPL